MAYAGAAAWGSSGCQRWPAAAPVRPARSDGSRRRSWRAVLRRLAVPDLWISLRARRVSRTGFSQETHSVCAHTEGMELTRPDGSPLRVLVVDDEVNIAELISDGAALRGLRGRRSRTPAPRPSPTARTFGPDAVVLDMMLPDFDGLEVLRRMRADRPRRTRPVPHRPRRRRGPGRRAHRRRRRLRDQAVLARGAGRPAARPDAAVRRPAGQSSLGAHRRRPRARRGQPRGTPRRRRDHPDRDRVRAAALPDAQPAPGAVARRRSSTGSGTTTSAARPTSSSSTSPTCARRSTPAASR